jgi:hypothetical protein
MYEQPTADPVPFDLRHLFGRKPDDRPDNGLRTAPEADNITSRAALELNGIDNRRI